MLRPGGFSMPGDDGPVDPYFGKYRDVYFESSNLRLHYTEWNPTGDDAIVLVHGLNVQLHTWDPIADDLARDRRVICVDLRGHGESQWASEGYRLEHFVGDLTALVDHCGLGHFDLVGHSLGARVVIGWAGMFRDRVRTLALSDTGPETPRAGAMQAKSTQDRAGDVRGFRNDAEALAFYEEAHPEWLPEFRELHVRHQLRRNWANKLVFRADPDLFWILGSIAKSETATLWEASANITAPTLLCVGETSPFFDEELVDRMQNEFQDLTVQYFKTGHYIPRERPDDFVRALRAFLSEHR